MDLKERLHQDILMLENELHIVQDEMMYNDKSDYYLLNRLAELRIISVQRRIIMQGEELNKLKTKHDSPEMKAQIEAINNQIKEEAEKNQEIEFQYENFANIYLGQDNSMRSEMLKILDEYEQQGIYVQREIVDKTDEYMFDNYAVTEEKMKKASSDGEGGRGLGLGNALEGEQDMDV